MSTPTTGLVGHAGLVTAARPPILEQLRLDPAALVTGDYPPGGGVGLYVPVGSRGAYVPPTPETYDRSVLRRILRNTSADVTVVESALPHVVSGVGLRLLRCHVGSMTLPDATVYRASTDGAQLAVPGGHTLAPGWTPQRSGVIDCDVLCTDPPTAAHQDGVQCWSHGRLDVVGTRITGWWQSAVMLKSDRGPIDDVRIHGCDLGGARWFLVRVIDGGYGRPTRVTITDNVLRAGGGRFPVNSGDDRCTDRSQTRFVRSEAERRDPAWIVYDRNVTPDGVEIPPPGGWHDPGPITLTPPTTTTTTEQP